MSSLIRPNPSLRLVPLRDAMDRLFEDVLVGSPFAEPSGRGLAVDLYETQDSLVVKVSIPGARAEDVQVTVIGNRLTIQGEIKDEQPSEGRNYLLRERRYGQFYRSLILPEEVMASNAVAEFEDGVLTVTIPKSEQAKTKSVTIKVT